MGRERDIIDQWIDGHSNGIFGAIVMVLILLLAMLVTLIVLWSIPADARPRYGAYELVSQIQAAESRHGLPPGLLAAVVLAESGGKWQVNRERIGGCSVCPAQVYDASCSLEFRRSLTLADCLDTGARLLRRSHEQCLRRPGWRACRLSSAAWGAGLYNARSSTWGARVAAAWRKLIP